MLEGSGLFAPNGITSVSLRSELSRRSAIARCAEDQERQNFVEEMVEDISGDGDNDD